MDIVPATSALQIEHARELFHEYARWVAIDLSFQGFADEVARLPGDYAATDGTLLLALNDGAAAGCVCVCTGAGGTDCCGAVGEGVF